MYLALKELMRLLGWTDTESDTIPGMYPCFARAIEQGEIAIDKLSLAVKRADFLNRHLEQQLVNIEQDLKQLGQPPTSSGEGKTAP